MPLTNTLGWNSQQLLQDILPDPNLVFVMPLNELSGTTYDRCLLNQLTGMPNGSLGYSRPLTTYSTGRTFVEASTQYFSTPSSAALQTGDIQFTLALWVNKTANTAGGYPGLISKNDNATNIEYDVYWQNGTGITFAVSSNGTALTGSVTSPTVGLNGWHLVVCWHDSDANTLNIQIDGGTVTSANYSAGVRAGTADVEVGKQVNQYFTGYIGPIDFWKRILTSSERTALYRGDAWGASYAQLAYVNSALTNGLQASWNMTAASGNEADSVGSATLTQHNAPATASGVVLPEPYDAYGMYFPGLTSSYISLGNTSALGFTQTTPFSILAVTTQTADVSATIINKFYASGDNGWLLQLLSGGNLGKTWFVLKEKTGSQITVLGSTSRSLGTSYMVGVSYDGSNLNTGLVCYNNGTSDVGAQAGGPLGPVPTNSRAACIGVLDSGNSSPFQGGIGLVAVFNSAKTAIDFRRWATLGGFR